MRPISQSWFVQIDVTSRCGRGCLYCSRYDRHLDSDRRWDMSPDRLAEALASVEGWPSRIGIIGGEPTKHPQFPKLCEVIRARYPASKMGLWTSTGPSLGGYADEVRKTFAFIANNEHNSAQSAVCRHQPLTVAIEEAVPDPILRDILIDDCWVERTWCPAINRHGAYFCEIAAAQDELLYDGANAWPLTRGWWRKVPGEYSGQICKLCGKCGMPVPLPREKLDSPRAKITPRLLETLRTRNLPGLEPDRVELFTETLNLEKVRTNAETWYPGNYREDRVADSGAAQCRGLSLPLPKELPGRLPSITVVVPTMGRSTLPATLSSIADAGLLPDDRVIVVTDGPVAGLAKLLAATSLPGDRVTVVAGPTTKDYGNAQINIGLDMLASGELSLVMDDDDEYAPGIFDHVRRMSAAYPDHGLLYSTKYMTEHLWTNKVIYSGNIATSMVAIPAGLIGRVRRTPGRGSDYRFVRDISANAPFRWLTTAIAKPQWGHFGKMI